VPPAGDRGAAASSLVPASLTMPTNIGADLRAITVEEHNTVREAMAANAADVVQQAQQQLEKVRRLLADDGGEGGDEGVDGRVG
jgi:precorrin-2 methylase